MNRQKSAAVQARSPARPARRYGTRERLALPVPLRPRPETRGSHARLPDYSVLIRTFNCEALLPATLKALAAQTHPPSAYVFVDSGSTDRTVHAIPDGAQLHRFVGGAFNYSEAINQGLDFVPTAYVLILSAHMVIGHRGAVERMVRLLESTSTIGAAYMNGDNSSPLRHDFVERDNFTGFNGLSNACAVIRTDLLRERRFRPEVFSAEDQEWARWLLFDRGQRVARFSGAGIVNNNPRKHFLRKRLNEYVAIAYFVDRKMLEWRHLARIAFRIVQPWRWPALRERLFNLVLLARLLCCYVVAPRSASRYY